MESKILGLLIRCGLLKLEWFLALRAVTQKSVEFFKSVIFKSYDTQMGAGSCCAKYETDYKSFYNLVTMEGKREAAGTEVFKAYTIVFLLRLLKKAGYFSNNSWHRKLGADEKLIGNTFRICYYEQGLKSLYNFRENAVAFHGSKHFQCP